MDNGVHTEHKIHHVDGFDAPFTNVVHINTMAATPYEDFIKNCLENIKLKVPRLQNLPGFQKVKGKNKKIAIVGGGPSVKTQIEKIREFNTIIVAGSAHDFLRENNITPTYGVICDPDPVSINYYKNLDTETTYLIATSCDPKIINHFKDHQLVLWHCHEEQAAQELRKVEESYYGIAGGCTVGLRSICIAIMLGYSNIHLFGFDSCLGENKEHHAYGFSTEAEEDYGITHKIKLGKDEPGEKTYTCIGYQLAQAHHFKAFYFEHFKLFTPTFHGEGMLQDLGAMMKIEVEKHIASQKETIQ